MLASIFSRSTPSTTTSTTTAATETVSDYKAWPSGMPRAARQSTGRAQKPPRGVSSCAAVTPSRACPPAPVSPVSPVADNSGGLHGDHEQDVGAGDADEIPDGESGFSRFVNHRWAGTSIEIQVEWEDGDMTWEPEANLHADALETLLRYWATKGGRPSNPLAPDMYDIFAIRKHSKDRRRLMVEWVGYDPKETSWIRRTVVEDTAPQLVEDYWKALAVREPV